jgi:uncharacterized repeat protein (TIGR03803 family)
MRTYSLLLFCLLLAGCSTAPAGSGAVPATIKANAGRVTRSVAACNLIYQFGGQPDGSVPQAGLANLEGKLYGTTTAGGTDDLGTVYSVTSSGSEAILHSFTGSPDGDIPEAGLVDVGGTFYGTTSGGGSESGGTVFEISKTGKLHIVYSFTGGSDGSSPEAGLIYVKGELYGTTYGGGSNGYGTVFKVTKSGTENAVYSFAGGTDGANPRAGLIYYKGAFYGTTYDGGGSNGYGTVFKVTRSGAESVLHSFAGGSDGAKPFGTLLAVGNALYGTTSANGGSQVQGTVFKITPSGHETVLHNFGGSGDGTEPEAGLINVDGTLFGTTLGYDGPEGTGTVYSIGTSGGEQVLCSFPSSDLDAEPAAPVLYFNNKLYGTTQGGGGPEQGTVFTSTL